MILVGKEEKRIMKEYKIMEDRSYENLSKLFIDGYIPAVVEVPGQTIIVESTGTMGRTAATAAFGLTGLVATMGKSKEQLYYSGCLRASKEGLHMDNPLRDGKEYDDWFVE